MRTSVVFDAKKSSDFPDLRCIRTDKEEEVNFFAILNGHPLWTAPNEGSLRLEAKMLFRSINKSYRC